MMTPPEAERLVCYCFGYSLEDLARDPGLAAVIEDHVRAGRCACKVRNPRGICCLGDVRKAVRLPPVPGGAAL
jgi:hypothetical protein